MTYCVGEYSLLWPFLHVVLRYFEKLEPLQSKVNFYMPSKNKQSSKVNSGKVKAKTEQVSNKSAYLVLALAGCTISLLYLFFKNAPKPNSYV